MTAVRLETRVHVITAAGRRSPTPLSAATRLASRWRATYRPRLERCGGDEERSLALCSSTSGATTDIAVWYDNALVHTTSLAAAATSLPANRARPVHTGEAAERIKQRYGCAMASMIANGETMEVPGVGGRDAQIRQRHLLCEILSQASRTSSAGSAGDEVAGCQRSWHRHRPHRRHSAPRGHRRARHGRHRRHAGAHGHASGLGGLHDVVDDPRYATAVGLCLADYDGLSGQSGYGWRAETSMDEAMRRIIDQWF